jgi:hypothetical protein
MRAVERERYRLTCHCGQIGLAYWQENDGLRFLNRGPETVVEVSPEFAWQWPVPDGDTRSFFGRLLVCKRCGQQPETVVISAMEYYADPLSRVLDRM